MVSANCVSADTRAIMDGTTPVELRQELARLEVAEAQISAERRRLHNQIDFGFATDSTRAREREVSAERRELHRRIDALRELLGAEEAAVAESPLSRLSQWSGISAEVGAAGDASTEEPEL
jgi:uncharacterized protein YlxW (UPF0749 family)